ncbi:MFS transporter [Longirhabdus pacifica]|uniref:MFS transporter n=1 Tax=Longirhabdus pacifica TaxID=2305227 RepID=UPI0010089CDA|nr:MFS transporter [Longirhabdus pacifica]
MGYQSVTSRKQNQENTNMLFYALGKLISLLGTSLFTFASSLYILDITGSGLSFATNMVIGLIPVILITPFAGVIADKINRKLLVIGADTLNGILFLAFFMYFLNVNITVSLIYTCTFMTNLLTTIFNAAFDAAKPNLVSDDRLAKINGISQIVMSVSTICGPVLGAILYVAVDLTYFFLINSITFFVSAIIECFIRFQLYQAQQTKQKDTKIEWMKDIKDGFAYMKQKKQLFSMILLFMGVNFFISFSYITPIPYIINEQLQLPKIQFGIIEGSLPVGIILGSIIVGRIAKGFHMKKLIRYIYCIALIIILFSVPTIGPNIPLTVWFIYYCVLMFLFGIVLPLINVPVETYLMRMIDDEYRGRVLSLLSSGVRVITPIAIVIGGALVNYTGGYLLVLCGGILLFMYAWSQSKSPTMQTLEEPITSKEGATEGL